MWSYTLFWNGFICLNIFPYLHTCIYFIPFHECTIIYLTSSLLKEVRVLPCFFSFLFFLILGQHLRHVEIPRLRVKLELQLQAYTPVTAMQDLSCACNLHCSSRQHQILNPLSEARDWTCILMDTRWVHFHWDMTGDSAFKSMLFSFRLKWNKISVSLHKNKNWFHLCFSLQIAKSWTILLFPPSSPHTMNNK